MFEAYTIITEVLGEPRYTMVNAIEESFESCKQAVAETIANNNKKYNCSCDVYVACKIGTVFINRLNKESILNAETITDIPYVNMLLNKE